MIATDEDALICDLAEVYGIFNYRSLPVRLVATLSVGLRDESRIKSKLANQKQPLDTLLLGAIVDRLSFLIWMQTEDGAKNKNRPRSIVDDLLGNIEEKEVKGFESAEAFEEAWKNIIGGI